jgi:dTDP-4-dehydrorhamnose reductase
VVDLFYQEQIMRLLLTGASGNLGAYLLRALRGSDISVVAWSGSQACERFGFPLEPVNLGDEGQLASAFARAGPDLILHAGALASVAACYREPTSARAINLDGSEHLVSLAAERGARLVFVSTDLVFDGRKGSYAESDPPGPLSVYGQTKAAAEQQVLKCPGAVVARVSLLFGPTLIARASYFDEQITALQTGQPIRAFVDEWRTPLSLANAARSLLVLARSDYEGLIHLGGPERLSRWEMAQQTAEVLDLDPKPIERASQADLSAPEPRPRDTSLDSSRWQNWFPDQPWPTFSEALQEMLPT